MDSSRNTTSLRDLPEWSLPVIQNASHMRKSTSNFRLVDPYRETGNSGTWMSFRDTGYMSLNPKKSIKEVFDSKRVKTETRKKTTEIFLRTRSEFSIKDPKTESLYYETIMKRIISTASSYAPLAEEARRSIRANQKHLLPSNSTFSQKFISTFLEEAQSRLKSSLPLSTGTAINSVESLLNQANCLASAVLILQNENISQKQIYEKEAKSKIDYQSPGDYIEVDNSDTDKQVTFASGHARVHSEPLPGPREEQARQTCGQRSDCEE